MLLGCSSFNRDWKAALLRPPQSNDFTGPWQGKWRSDVTGHNGALRCLVSELPEGRYQARFHAKYKKIFSFGYTVPLEVQRHDAVFRFRGEANLGKLAGGIYEYDGHASVTNFFSLYRSKSDHGTFQMDRPPRPQ
jgi:hypothetical protein